MRDVRREFAAAAPQSRWPFDALAEAIRDPVVIWSAWRDETGDIVDFVYEYVNEAAVNIIGIAPDELLGQRLLEILPVHRELGLYDRYRMVALTGESDLIQIPWFEDGNVAGAFEASVSVIGDCIVSVARDVTQRVLAERELEEAAELHQFLAENASERLVRLTNDGIVSFSSQPPGVGLEASDMLGIHFVKFVHPDDRQIVTEVLDAARSTGSTAQVDFRMASAAYDHFPWVALRATSVFDASAQLEFHLSIRDIEERRAAEQALAAAERMQRLILDTLAEGVVLGSDEEGIVNANRAATELLGLNAGSDTSHDQVSGSIGGSVGLFELDGSPLDPDDTPATRVRRTGQPERGRLLELRSPDAGSRWIEASAVLVDDEGEPDAADAEDAQDEAVARPVRVLTTFVDLTERVLAERRVEQERRLLHATFDSVHAGLMAVHGDGTIIEVNQRFRDLTRGPHQVGQKLADLTYEYSILDQDGVVLERDQQPIGRALAGEHITDMTTKLVWPDGIELIVLASASPIYSADGTVGAVLTVHDVTELRAAEEELRTMATVDQLTGLPNRRAVLARLDEAIERKASTSDELAVLFLDLDGFKSINDTLGHDAGDELLQAVAQRLTGTMRSTDLIGRMGGDEFVAVLERFSDEQTNFLAVRIETELSRPFLLDAGVATIGVSVGRAVHTASHTAETMLAAADVEMYRVKHERAGEPRS
jgi:diguanylate cyclase (GGDEF)-like protein/PAS domain S-box-containing protein